MEQVQSIPKNQNSENPVNIKYKWPFIKTYCEKKLILMKLVKMYLQRQNFSTFRLKQSKVLKYKRLFAKS